MGFRTLLKLSIAVALITPTAFGGKYGFADKNGGGANDPIIEVSASIGPDAGALFSFTPEQANSAFAFQNSLGTYGLNQTLPLIPRTASNLNQFISIKFPFKISSKKVVKTIMKDKANLAANSFLVGSGISFSDENGVHVPGIATIAGKNAAGKKIKKQTGFPKFLDSNQKNQLAKKNVFTYIADDGDNDVTTPSAFSPTGDPNISGIDEIRVKVDRIDGVTINGFWVLRVSVGGASNPTLAPRLVTDGVGTVTGISALDPVSPPKTQLGFEVVETFSKYRIEFTEPVVPRSVGFSAKSVKDFNASNPPFPFVYNGNTAPVYDPLNLAFSYFRNTQLQAAAQNGAPGFTVPFDVRPINPNNLSTYIVNPILDVPGKTTVTLSVFAFSANSNATALGTVYSSAATSLYNLPFNDPAAMQRSFRTSKGRAFTNAPVAPGVLYYIPLSGAGMGAVNLDGMGAETNDPATERLLIFTSNNVICACASAVLPGSHLSGCNGNAFGDGTGANPIGIAGNPIGTHLGPPTPFPGVNEGSTGTTANGFSPIGIFPPGFETLVKNSEGNTRLADSPELNSVVDGEIGDFLDTLFFDRQSFGAISQFHASFIIGTGGVGNFISDPPLPNPPPLRLPVGLQPVDIVFSEQKLLKPAFVIEGEEVFPSCIGCPPGCNGGEKILLLPNSNNPAAGDALPNYAQNGPLPQTFLQVAAYAARQQIGNFLYVADRDAGSISVLNSNTFTVLDRITLPDPYGVAVSPDTRRLYVSNYADDSLSIVSIDPFAADFHQEISRVNVGFGPISVSAQPDGEDAVVCNYQGNSLSFLDAQSLTIRDTIFGPLVRPTETILTARQGATGWRSGVYFGYIASQGTGDLLIYESGPDGASGFGGNSIRWAATQAARFDDMSALAFDPIDYPGAVTSFNDQNLPNRLMTGVYVPHKDDETGLAMITRVVFTRQLPMPGPLTNSPLPGTILSSPGVIQRIFETVGFWGGPLVPFISQLNPGGQDQRPYDIAFSDMSMANYFQAIPTIGFDTAVFKTNAGSAPAPVSAGSRNHKHPTRFDANGNPIPVYFPDRMYVSFAGDNRIVVLDPQGIAGTGPLNTIENVSTPGKLIHWFDQ